MRRRLAALALAVVAACVLPSGALADETPPPTQQTGPVFTEESACGGIVLFPLFRDFSQTHVFEASDPAGDAVSLSGPWFLPSYLKFDAESGELTFSPLEILGTGFEQFVIVNLFGIGDWIRVGADSKNGSASCQVTVRYSLF